MRTYKLFAGHKSDVVLEIVLVCWSLDLLIQRMKSVNFDVIFFLFVPLYKLFFFIRGKASHGDEDKVLTALVIFWLLMWCHL